MTEFMEQQLLFGISIDGDEGVLDFVDFDTLESDSPVLFRCRVRKRWVDDFVPGGLYRMELKNDRIVQYIKDREFIITQPYYIMLLERRHLRYETRSEPFRPSEYYTFDDWRALFLFSHSPGLAFLSTFCRKLIAALFVLISPALFVVYCLALFRMQTLPTLLPLAIIGAIPFTVWGLISMNTLSTQLLLRWPFTRYPILRDYCIRHSGKRFGLGIPAKTKKRLLISGGITLLVFLLSLLMLFF